MMLYKEMKRLDPNKESKEELYIGNAESFRLATRLNILRSLVPRVKRM
jgi:hypothetical protein